MSEIDFSNLTLAQQVKAIKETKQIHSNWYRQNYPDVAALKMDPAEHYLRFGAMLGRNPGKSFDTKFYAEQYLVDTKNKVNPLLHYALIGKEKSYYRSAKSAKQSVRKLINQSRKNLYTYGMSEKPLEDLKKMYESHTPYISGLAAYELSLWNMRLKEVGGYKKALTYIEVAKANLNDEKTYPQLLLLQFMCLYFLNDKERLEQLRLEIDKGSMWSIDLKLVFSNLVNSVNEKVIGITHALQEFDIPKLSLVESLGNLPYDQLSVAEKLPKRDEKYLPTVTVLIAAYNAEDTIKTTVRSLQEQTWKNLEILILDDCSSDDTVKVANELAEVDPRIKVVEMPVNGGAYVARNHGLDLANGEYVTIHDADDWSHPIKIETQAMYLECHPNVVGCTSQQARADSYLEFTRWTGNGKFTITNTSSFMYRKEPIKSKIGYWDTVRFSADNEFIRRIQKVFGESSVIHLETGPLSFQRDSDSSIVANEHFGINGALYGARYEYFEAQTYFRETAPIEDLKYNNARMLDRPFAAPLCMLPDRNKVPRHFDVIIVSDFRMPGGSVLSCVEEIKAHRKNGLSTGLIQLCRDDINNQILPEVRNCVDGEHVSMLVFGEDVTCDTLIVRYPPVLQNKQKYIPNVKANRVHIIVNQPPMSEYSEAGVFRYSIETCNQNAIEMFGEIPVWYPIGPLVRDSLLTHHLEDVVNVNLSNENWYNIIDIDEWFTESRYSTLDPSNIKIGRHSRDNYVKWPEKRQQLLQAYPADKHEVHVLGGASSAVELIGELPSNWQVSEFNELTPQEFLKEIDVFVYYTHSGWIESFGRVILEALAANVPVVLPYHYKPLFKDAAIYADISDVQSVVEKLVNNKNEYEAQLDRAQKFLHENFSYQHHISRVLSKDTHSLKQIQVPKNSGKTPASALDDMKRISLKDFMSDMREPAMVKFSDGLNYDMLWQPKADASKLFVMLSGDAMRSKYEPPIFQRWSWAPFMPGHCLYISDPTILLSDKMGLAWYSGTQDHYPCERIADLIKDMVEKLKIEYKDVVLYASSGGGFAALKTATFLQGVNVVAINPQTDISKFDAKSVERYFNEAWGYSSRKEAMSNNSERFSLLNENDVNALKQNNVIYIQNTVDTHHYLEHFSPFCRYYGIAPVDGKFGNFSIMLFEHEGGHKKAESPEVFTRALNNIVNR